ncbi:hypothetical protein DVA80_21100, partial [Acinetobacter baumannii]
MGVGGGCGGGVGLCWGFWCWWVGGCVCCVGVFGGVCLGCCGGGCGFGVVLFLWWVFLVVWGCGVLGGVCGLVCW